MLLLFLPLLWLLSTLRPRLLRLTILLLGWAGLLLLRLPAFILLFGLALFVALMVALRVYRSH